jgi:predicted AlkP superfamily phosphohydrolase/phosphomutase
VNLKDRMAGIDANLDDLQSGIEASTRTADVLHSDAAGFAQTLKYIKNAPVIESLVRRAAELQVSARDQRGVIQELREAITRLQEELKFSKGSLGPAPLSSAADRSRR